VLVTPLDGTKRQLAQLLRLPQPVVQPGERQMWGPDFLTKAFALSAQASRRCKLKRCLTS